MLSGGRYPIARYRFECQADTAIALPEYAGSVLRGAFGAALRHLACMTHAPACPPCPLYRTCPYPRVFETPPPDEHCLQKFSQVPNAYVVEPPDWGVQHIAAGAPWQFHLVLIGDAQQHWPLIVLAWQRALARGIGRGQGRSTLCRIHHLGDAERLVYAADEGHLHEHDATLFVPPPPAAAGWALHLATPLRLQNNGHPLGPEQLTARTLLMALVRRAALIGEFHMRLPPTADFTALAASAGTIGEHRDLRWRDWKRYSGRQKQEMALGGVVGRWQLQGDLTPFWPWLYLGQWLHVGKNASFGLGRYTLEPTT